MHVVLNSKNIILELLGCYFQGFDFFSDELTLVQWFISGILSTFQWSGTGVKFFIRL